MRAPSSSMAASSWPGTTKNSACCPGSMSSSIVAGAGGRPQDGGLSRARACWPAWASNQRARRRCRNAYSATANVVRCGGDRCPRPARERRERDPAARAHRWHGPRPTRIRAPASRSHRERSWPRNRAAGRAWFGSPCGRIPSLRPSALRSSESAAPSITIDGPLRIEKRSRKVQDHAITQAFCPGSLRASTTGGRVTQFRR